MRKRQIVGTFLVLFACSNCLEGQKTLTLDSSVLTEREVAIGLDVPWELQWGPDDHIWFTERAGKVKRLNPGTGNVTTILDLTSIVTSIDECGMLGFCFHPDFESNGKIFLAYDRGPSEDNLTKRISTFTWNGTDLENEAIILDGISSFKQHSGCRMIISKDEKLLVTIGDKFQEERALDLVDLHGKLLRINLDGSVPDDNPFSNNYVYAYGLRNSQGLGYGPNGELFVSDHGHRQSDEVNRVTAGSNHGWPEVEGACDDASEDDYCQNNQVTTPLVEWSPCIAVGDLVSYDHPAIPEWRKKMLVAALGGFFAEEPSIRVLTFNDTDTDVIGEEFYFTEYGRIRDVCINPHNGAIFFATNGRSYPSAGPNRIIEYRNLNYTSVHDHVLDEDQFLRISPSVLNRGDDLKVEYSQSFRNATLELFSLKGEKMREQMLDDAIIRTFGLSAGPYFVKATNQNGTITQKFMIVE